MRCTRIYCSAGQQSQPSDQPLISWQRCSKIHHSHLVRSCPCDRVSCVWRACGAKTSSTYGSISIMLAWCPCRCTCICLVQGSVCCAVLSLCCVLCFAAGNGKGGRVITTKLSKLPRPSSVSSSHYEYSTSPQQPSSKYLSQRLSTSSSQYEYVVAPPHGFQHPVPARSLSQSSSHYEYACAVQSPVFSSSPEKRPGANATIHEMSPTLSKQSTQSQHTNRKQSETNMNSYLSASPSLKNTRRKSNNVSTKGAIPGRGTSTNTDTLGRGSTDLEDAWNVNPLFTRPEGFHNMSTATYSLAGGGNTLADAGYVKINPLRGETPDSLGSVSAGDRDFRESASPRRRSSSTFGFGDSDTSFDSIAQVTKL